MSRGINRLRCICGYIINDFRDKDPLPYKAYFLPDEDLHPALDAVMTEVATFIVARERGEQEQYLQQHDPGLLAPHEASLKDILAQTVHYHVFQDTAFARDYGRAIYECVQCGRLWMHTSPHRAEWVSYVPESSERGILSHDGTSVE